MLTCHGGRTPHDEIWIKVGGDVPAGSELKGIQLQSKYLACASAEDYQRKLSKILERFERHLEELQGMKWQNKYIRLSLYGY